MFYVFELLIIIGLFVFICEIVADIEVGQNVPEPSGPI